MSKETMGTNISVRMKLIEVEELDRMCDDLRPRPARSALAAEFIRYGMAVMKRGEFNSEK